MEASNNLLQGWEAAALEWFEQESPLRNVCCHLLGSLSCEKAGSMMITPHVKVITANPRSDASRVSDEDSTCPSDSMEWHNNQPTARTTQNEETVKTDPEDEVEEIDVVGDSDPLENYGKENSYMEINTCSHSR